MGLLDLLVQRRTDVEASLVAVDAEEPAFTTKTLRKFLTALTVREWPVLLDLGPVVGSDVSFFGEQLGCKIFVEDLFVDIDRHVRSDRLDALPGFLRERFAKVEGAVDGILCWDLIDYLDRGAAQTLGEELTRLLRPEGALLAFFGTAHPRDRSYTKYIIADESTLKYRCYDAARGRQAILLNRDIIRLFPALRVSDSILLQNNLREILFRKPDRLTT